MQTFIGREAELQVFADALQSPSAELVAVFGRRRVGKTFLIRHACAKQLVFDFSGIKNGKTAVQLERFSRTLAKSFDLATPLEPAKTWLQAFDLLADLLEKTVKRSKQKRVVFLDEFPWNDDGRYSALFEGNQAW